MDKYDGGGNAESFEQAVERVWPLVVKKYPNLKDMKVNLGVSFKKDLTLENIREIEAKVE